ncbi:MAG: FAD-dependent oxidoreductase, partial [Calditrichota bacterium]
YLAELAAGAGAEIRTRCDAVGLLNDSDQTSGVIYERMGRKFSVAASVVIAADGVESRVGRWAGIDTKLPLKDMGSAYQMVLAGIQQDDLTGKLYFGRNWIPNGYIWVFPKGGGTFNVGGGVFNGEADSGEVYGYVRRFIKKMFGHPAVISEMTGAIPLAPPLSKPFAAGVLLAGDAARFCNPLSGGGDIYGDALRASGGINRR